MTIKYAIIRRILPWYNHLNHCPGMKFSFTPVAR